MLLVAPVLSTPTTHGDPVPRHVPLDHDAGHLHFSHPLIAESPSPDTKLRFNALHTDGAEGTELEAEYAFDPSFSLEVSLPFESMDPEGGPDESGLGNVHLAFKLANFAFERQGLLLGYGIEFGLPTGDDGKGIGSDNELEIEPFLNLGYKREALELVAFTNFGIPTNQNGEEVETELKANVSSLYHFDERWSGLFELDGQGVLSGEGEGRWGVNATPGVKWAPTGNPKFQVGLGLRFPLDDRDEYDTNAVFSIFLHH